MTTDREETRGKPPLLIPTALFDRSLCWSGQDLCCSAQQTAHTVHWSCFVLEAGSVSLRSRRWIPYFPPMQESTQAREQRISPHPLYCCSAYDVTRGDREPLRITLLSWWWGLRRSSDCVPPPLFIIQKGWSSTA